MRRRVPTLILAVSLAAAFAAADQPCAKVLLRGAENPDKTETGFSATKTTDIVFTVLLLPQLAGDRLLELRVRTPRGHLYQTIAVPLTEPGGPPERSVPGYPRPLKTKVPSRDKSSALKVEVPFPVGGTMIQTSSLYGAWSVEIALDGAEAPCGPATAFTISE